MAIQMSTSMAQNFVAFQPQQGMVAGSALENPASGNAANVTNRSKSFQEVFGAIKEATSGEANITSARRAGLVKSGDWGTDVPEGGDVRLKSFLKIAEKDESKGRTDEVSSELMDEFLALQEAVHIVKGKGRFDPDAILHDEQTKKSENLDIETLEGLYSGENAPKKPNPLPDRQIAFVNEAVNADATMEDRVVPAMAVFSDGQKSVAELPATQTKPDPSKLEKSLELSAADTDVDGSPEDAVIAARISYIPFAKETKNAKEMTTEKSPQTPALAIDALETLGNEGEHVETGVGDAGERAERGVEEVAARFGDARGRSGGNESSAGDAELNQWGMGAKERRLDASKAANAVIASDVSAETSAANRPNSSSTSPAQIFAAEFSNASQRSEAASSGAKGAMLPSRPDMTQILDRRGAFGDGVTKVLEFLRLDGTNVARIVVEPPALGRIDVSLQAGNHGVEAAFKVDSENLQQVLQQQLDSLKSSLEAQGIHVSSLTVDIGNNKEDQKGRADVGQQGRKSRRISGAEAAEEGLEEGKRLVRLDLEKGLLHWIA